MGNAPTKNTFIDFPIKDECNRSRQIRSWPTASVEYDVDNQATDNFYNTDDVNPESNESEMMQNASSGGSVWGNRQAALSGSSILSADSKDSADGTDLDRASCMLPEDDRNEGGGRSRTGRTRKRRHVKVGQYVGVAVPECQNDACLVEVKRTGQMYRKCHCRVADQRDGTFCFVHMGNESMAVWLTGADDKVHSWSDEYWCAHGKLCNHMIRRKACKNYEMYQKAGKENGSIEECGCRQFCHNKRCIQGFSRNGR